MPGKYDPDGRRGALSPSKNPPEPLSKEELAKRTKEAFLKQKASSIPLGPEYILKKDKAYFKWLADTRKRHRLLLITA